MDGFDAEVISANCLVHLGECVVNLGDFCESRRIVLFISANYFVNLGELFCDTGPRHRRVPPAARYRKPCGARARLPAGPRLIKQSAEMNKKQSAERVRGCLQESEEVTKDFSSLLDDEV